MIFLDNEVKQPFHVSTKQKRILLEAAACCLVERGRQEGCEIVNSFSLQPS